MEGAKLHCHGEEGVMKAKGTLSKVRKNQKKEPSASPLARKALALKREKKKQTIIAAMENSQRKGASEWPSRISAALVRTVEAAKLRRKKQTVAGAMEESQRAAGTSKKPRSSEALERTVAAAGRLRKKTEITAALEESQRRSASQGG